MDALEDLEVWKRACRLSVNLYSLMSDCREYAFKDQITRAGLSIASNIAEGYERETIPSRIQFFKISKGSCGEVWTQLKIGRAAGFVEHSIGKELEAEVREISRMLWGLIQYFKKHQTS
ncbi:MAG: four helix bundle protein [Gammaproteobacteria bacterium]|jgi:four helix bundle protein